MGNLKTNLTEKLAKRATWDPKKKTAHWIWDGKVTGFGLRVQKTKRTFHFRWTDPDTGSKKSTKIGEHPYWSVDEARAVAERLRAEARGDNGNVARKAEAERDEVKPPTFRKLAEEVMKAKAKKTREATIRERERILEKDLLPAWGDRPAREISRREVLHLVEEIEQGTKGRKPAPTMANRTLALVRLIFNEGLRRGFPTLEANPAHMMEPPGVEEGRDRYLKRHEIREVWKALEADPSPVVRGAFRLALLTGQRMGSVAKMRWEQVEDYNGGKVWRIPAETFKGKRPHVVPLSPEAMEVLEEAKAGSRGGWVFPGRKGTKAPHLAAWNNSLRRVREKTEIPHWVAHDFRTTFRTHATRALEDGGLGVPGHVADAVLGHAENSLGFRRYTGDQERYLLHEKAGALEAWGEWVRKAVKDSS